MVLKFSRTFCNFYTRQEWISVLPTADAITKPDAPSRYMRPSLFLVFFIDGPLWVSDRTSW